MILWNISKIITFTRIEFGFVDISIHNMLKLDNYLKKQRITKTTLLNTANMKRRFSCEGLKGINWTGWSKRCNEQWISIHLHLPFIHSSGKRNNSIRKVLNFKTFETKKNIYRLQFFRQDKTVYTSIFPSILTRSLSQWSFRQPCCSNSCFCRFWF